jgi:hypothetical protein
MTRLSVTLDTDECRSIRRTVTTLFMICRNAIARVFEAPAYSAPCHSRNCYARYVTVEHISFGSAVRPVVFALARLCIRISQLPAGTGLHKTIANQHRNRSLNSARRATCTDAIAIPRRLRRS